MTLEADCGPRGGRRAGTRGRDDTHFDDIATVPDGEAVLRRLRGGAVTIVGDDPILADRDLHVAFTGPVTMIEAPQGRYAALVEARLFSHEVHIEDVVVRIQGAVAPWMTVDAATLEETEEG